MRDPSFASTLISSFVDRSEPRRRVASARDLTRGTDKSSSVPVAFEVSPPKTNSAVTLTALAPLHETRTHIIRAAACLDLLEMTAETGKKGMFCYEA